MKTSPDLNLFSPADIVALMAHGILAGGGLARSTREEIAAEARAMAALMEPPLGTMLSKLKWENLAKPSETVGWQDHVIGGKLPLAEAKVEVRLRDGTTFVDIAGKLSWDIQRIKADIIQWRYVK